MRSGQSLKSTLEFMSATDQKKIEQKIQHTGASVKAVTFFKKLCVIVVGEYFLMIIFL